MDELSGPAPPRRAATLVLLRDDPAEGLQVLMGIRHARSPALPGALVFPGGKVEAEDDLAAGAGGALHAERVAAIRETFEECGILLARTAETGAALEAAEVASISARAEAAMAGGAHPAFRAMLKRERIDPATGDLAYFAHWISPETAPRRFDTRFFLAERPPGQDAVHDGREMSDSVWIAPARALEAASSGRYDVPFPTERNLAKLARFGLAADAMAAARAAPVVTVQAVVTPTATGRRLVIPAEAAYGGTTFER